MRYTSIRSIALGQARRQIVSTQGCSQGLIGETTTAFPTWLQQLACARAALLLLLSLREAGGTDALGRRKACCRHAFSFVTLLLPGCARRSARSPLCALHESVLVATVAFSLVSVAHWSCSIGLPSGSVCGSVSGARETLEYAPLIHCPDRTQTPLRDCEHSISSVNSPSVLVTRGVARVIVSIRFI